MSKIVYIFLLINICFSQTFYQGVNVVYKGFPYHPNINEDNLYTSFTENDIRRLKSYNFNVVRLGIMWPGVEPQENQINTTYLEIMKSIVVMLDYYNISVILDFHQDLLSDFFCGEGIPNWLVPKLISNYTFNSFPSPLPIKKTLFTKPKPKNNECKKFNWIIFHFTYAVSKLFQSLYENPQYMKNYWINVAKTFRPFNNVIGYELFNEPWAGDIYKYPSLLYPGVAAKKNLILFYDKITEYIRLIDNNSLHYILFESITWDIFKVGFEKVPLDHKNSSILSYHAYYPPNINPTILFKSRMKDLNRLNILGFITEFDIGINKNPSTKSIKTLKKFLYLAKKYNQSWISWGYKSFYNITGDYNGFYNDNYSITEGANLLISNSK